LSNPGEADATPIDHVQQLADYLAAGCKPAASFKIGTEHESFGFRLSDHASPPYQPRGIRQLLETIEAGEHLSPIMDHGLPIGLNGGGLSLSLEPGGQFELSGGLLAHLHDTKAELDAHIARVRRVAPGIGLGFAPLGFHPMARREDLNWMPKSRYAIMRRYMPQVGTRGHDMMLRTCTVQVNLDFSSEADMVRKMRVAMALQPLATALFANSPFYEGKPNGLMSNRAQVWTDTDNQRAGIPAMVFEPGFGFERYVAWLLDVPMYFVARDGELIDVAGQSFRDFMAGKLPSLPGERATLGDFADHMTTVFPDVRLKRYLETRGADSGTPAMMLAQSAFWTGIFYDPAALSAAESLVADLSYADILQLRTAVPVTALGTPFRGGTLRDLARDAVAVSAAGLKARARLDAKGEDESQYLAPLHDIAAGAPNQAEQWLARYHGAWQGDVSRIFTEAAF
jgi:glutamate--cysteine ligase